jgi:hypothetical protein
MSAEFHRWIVDKGADFQQWIVDKGYATLTSDVQLMLWEAWLAGGLNALCKDLPNYSSALKYIDCPTWPDTATAKDK